MKKQQIVKNLLLVAGILLIVVFLGTVVYDYYLLKTRMFANPLGLEFTALMSGVLFLLPGIICIVVFFYLKRKIDVQKDATGLSDRRTIRRN